VIVFFYFLFLRYLGFVFQSETFVNYFVEIGIFCVGFISVGLIIVFCLFLGVFLFVKAV
jgi:hypothetical protein